MVDSCLITWSWFSCSLCSTQTNRNHVRKLTSFHWGSCTLCNYELGISGNHLHSQLLYVRKYELKTILPKSARLIVMSTCISRSRPWPICIVHLAQCMSGHYNRKLSLWCYWKQVVVSLCEAKAQCSVRVASRLFNRPTECPSVPGQASVYRLSVTYQCRPS